MLLAGKALIAGLATGALTGYVKNALDASVETLHLARNLGTTSNFINTVKQGVKDLGGDAGNAAAGLEAMSKAVAGANAGNIATNNAFDRIGLSAKELAGMNLEQQFSAVADAISKIENPTQRAAAAYAIFDDKAKTLLPLLTQGGAGIAKAKASMEGLGASVNDLSVAQVESMNLAFGRLSDYVSNLAGQFGIALAPVINLVIDYLESMGLSGKTGTAIIRSGMETAAYAVGVVLDVVQVVRSALEGMVSTFMGGIAQISSGVSGLFDLASSLPDSLGGKLFAETKKMADDFTAAMALAAAEMSAEAQNLFDTADNRLKMPEKFRQISEQAEQAAKSIEHTRNAAGSLTELSKHAELFKIGEELNESLATPLQKYQSELQKLDSALQAGAISWDTYARGISKAVDELEKAHELRSVQLAGATSWGTVEAYSAAAKAEAQETYSRETPDQRLQRIAEQSLEIERQQLEYQRRLAEAATVSPQVARIL